MGPMLKHETVGEKKKTGKGEPWYKTEHVRREKNSANYKVQ